LVYWQAGKWFYFTNFNGSIDWYCVNPYYPQFECNKSSGTIAQTMFCLVVVSRRGDSTCKKSQIWFARACPEKMILIESDEM
jgi:hypothetical protein